MKLTILSAVILSISLLSGGFTAEAQQQVCVRKNGNLVVRSDCKKLAPICNVCSPCGTNLAGEWSYYLVNSDNDSSPLRQITLTQTGDAFSGSDDYYTIIGKVSGNWVRLTMTVSGEEAEGWVALAEGSLYEKDLELEDGTVNRTYMNLVIVGDTIRRYSATSGNLSSTAAIFWRNN